MKIITLILGLLALALGTQAIAAELAVAADNAVAGHDERHGVGGASMTDRALGVGLANGQGNLAIAAGLAERDAPKLFPHASLEGGPTDIEGKVYVRLATRDEIDNRPHC